MKGRLALVGCCALVACRGSKVQQLTSAIDVTLANDGGLIESFADLLDAGLGFGGDPLLVPLTRVLTISDVGGGGLEVTSASIAGVDGGGVSPFSIVGVVPTSLGVGSGSPLAIQFLPAAEQVYSGTLTIASDDPMRPVVSIALAGTGSTKSALDVTPTPLDFLQVGQGQTQVATLTLASVGTAPLFVSGLSLGAGTDPAFAFVSSVTTPFQISNLAPGNTLPISLSFSPTATTPANPTGSVVIQSSDPAHQPFTVPLTGQALLAPSAAIVVPAVVAVGSLVTLDGSGSADPNHPPSLPLTYQWALQKKPLGSAAQLSSVTAVKPTLLADGPGIYDVQLDVTNAIGVQDLRGAHASITARPLEDLYIEMVWDNDPIDMDLHLLTGGATLNGPGDCTAYNADAGVGCQPSSDHLVGPGPEWVSLASPPAGTYTIDCVEYAAHNALTLATNVTVRVYVYGVLASELTQTVNTLGSVWEAGTVTWPSGAITAVNTVTP